MSPALIPVLYHHACSLLFFHARDDYNQMRWEYDVPAANSTSILQLPRKTVRRVRGKLKRLFGKCRSKQAQPHEQTSGFFKLPWEIRKAIYDLAFPELGEIHVVLKDRRLWGLEHPAPRPEPRNRAYGDAQIKRGVCRRIVKEQHFRCDYCRCLNGFLTKGAVRERHVVGPARLLTVCKWMYPEALRLLYSTYTFRFHTAASLLLFAHSIPPSHLLLISSLHIDLSHSFPYRFPKPNWDDTVRHFPKRLRKYYVETCKDRSWPYHDTSHSEGAGGKGNKKKRKNYPTQWAAVCVLLSTMTGLRHLRVSLASHRMQPLLRNGGEERVFAPLYDAVLMLKEEKKTKKMAGIGGGHSQELKVEIANDWIGCTWKHPEHVDYYDGSDGPFRARRLGACAPDEEKCEGCMVRTRMKTFSMR